MLGVLIWVVIFLVSLFILFKASDQFTDSAEKIGLWFGLPPFIIGVTIVAFGTSIPELVSSIFAVLKNSSEIVVSNVIGSNITNILLISGLAIILGKRISISYNRIFIDLSFLMLSTFLFAMMILDGRFGFGEGVLSLLLLIVYAYYITKRKKEYTHEKNRLKKLPFDWKTFFVLTLCLFFIFLSAKYVVQSVIHLSNILGVGKELITISIVALGTTLPELMVTITSARKGKSEIAVGNIIGSNIFNTLGVMGIPALIGVIVVPKNILTLGLPVMVLATVIYFFILRDSKVHRWKGFVLIALYLIFILKIVSYFVN